MPALHNDGLLERLRAVPAAALALAAVGDEPGVHVVGGAVRDLLLGRTPVEVDIVVEGDAVAVARRGASRLEEARVMVHSRFGTATIDGAAGVSVDLASARREVYERPGALPVVTPGVTLAEDLPRRDFTVNAIALALADGHLTEFPGALADLEAGVLRVLHDRSFQDDPTRLLRLARYAGRLGFSIEPSTRALAEAAVAGGALATLSPARIGNELLRLAHEPEPARGFAILHELALDRALAPGGAAADAERVTRDGTDPARALAAAWSALDHDTFAGWLKSLAMPRRERGPAIAAHAELH